MRTIDVAERDWPRTLDELSARHEGGLVTLEVFEALPAKPRVK